MCQVSRTSTLLLSSRAFLTVIQFGMRAVQFFLLFSLSGLFFFKSSIFPPPTHNNPIHSKLESSLFQAVPQKLIVVDDVELLLAVYGWLMCHHVNGFYGVFAGVLKEFKYASFRFPTEWLPSAAVVE